MAADAILEEMVRKVISAEVILDQRSDLQEENGRQGLVLKMITQLPKQTVWVKTWAPSY